MVLWVLLIGANAVGGAAMVCSCTTWNMGTRKAMAFSVQPMAAAHSAAKHALIDGLQSFRRTHERAEHGCHQEGSG